MSDTTLTAEHVAAGLVGTAPGKLETMKDLAAQTKAAKLALLEGIHGIGTALRDFKPESDKLLRELREFRMATNGELNQTLHLYGELRKFFLGPDHEKEIARLREFVELCERLKALKDSGFLDSVADTMLRLA